VATFSCSDDSSTGPDLPDPDPDPDPVSECNALKLQSNSAEPLTVITVTGVADEFGNNPAGWISDGENQIPIFLYRVEDSDHAQFALPVHPSGSIDGGTAEITFISSDAELECSGFEVTIQALEESPGELDRYTSAFQNGMDQLIQQLGFNSDDLINQSIDEMQPHMVPLAVVYKLISPDHYENNLNAILAGTAPILEGESVTDQQRQLLNALIAKSDLTSLAESFFEELTNDISTGKKKSVPTAFSQSNSLPSNSALIQYITPAELSDLRKMQDYLSGFPNLGNVNPEFPDLFTATHSLSMGIYGEILTGAAETSDPVLAATMTASITIVQHALNFILPDLLPGQNVEFEVISNPIDFNEDSEEIGAWTAELSAESRGHTVNTQQFIQQLPVDLWDDIPVIQDMIGNINQLFIESLDRIGIDLLGVAANDHLEFLPNTWIVLLDTEREDESDYFNWNLEHLDSWDGNPAFEFYTDPGQNIKPDMGYQPVNQGTAELQISVIGEEFALFHDPTESVKLTVKPIEIDLTPNEVIIYFKEAQPEDFEIDLIANVENADNEQLEWSTDSNQTFFDINDSNGHDVTFYVPDEIGTYTAIAEAVTNTGARTNQIPPRRDSTIVRVTEQQEELVIEPNPGCVTIDDEFAFSASFGEKKLSIQDLTWNLEGPGQIDDNGFFTPFDEGYISIHFEYNNPESGESHITTVEFYVLEGCGEFSVESDFFTYFTGCTSAKGSYEELNLPFDFSTVSAAGWTSKGGADIIVNMHTDIRDTGEWTRTLTRPSPVSGNSWGVPTFYDQSGDLWAPSDDVDNDSELLTIERVEFTLDGEIIGLLSGSFQVLMYNESQAERDDYDPEKRIESIFTGEFQGVPITDSNFICQ
jgi:hypothetical protein